MGIDANVNITLNNLVLELYQVIEDMAYQIRDLASLKNESETNFDVVSFINRPFGGKDINLRLEEAKDKLKNEFEAYISAGLVLDKSNSDIITQYGAFLSNPIASPMLTKARAEKAAEIASIWLLSGGLTYGKQNTKSGFTNMMRNGEVLNYLYNDIDYDIMRGNGAIGYVVYRGSSYPCQACDDNTGFHPIEEGYTLPVHGNCMCYAVQV